MEKVRIYIYTHFASITAFISGILAALYTWQGYKESFSVCAFIIIGLNILYIPFSILLKRKAFTWFNIFYALVLIFIQAFTKTYLYNNYSALFIICLIAVMNPHLKKFIFPAYLAAVCVAFSINEETIYHFLIHIIRGLWYIMIIFDIVSSKSLNKKLVLDPDEIKILEQISSQNIYQKEVEGYSENTVYRKLKSARERNGCATKDQLVELFKKEYLNK